MNLSISEALTDKENQIFMVEAGLYTFFGYCIGADTSATSKVTMATRSLALFFIRKCITNAPSSSTFDRFLMHVTVDWIADRAVRTPNSSAQGLNLQKEIIASHFIIPFIAKGIVSLARTPFTNEVNEPAEESFFESIFGAETPAFEPINPDQIEVSFQDVAGIDQAKEEVIEVVDFLKNPDKYINMGAKIPKGLMLYGPPGTGKTMLAKATAKEAEVPFFEVSSSQIEGVYVGESAQNIRELFKSALAQSPCIIYIDEIDALVPNRNSSLQTHKNDLTTISELLSQMDGFKPSSGIIVMAATNRLESIDPAVLRSGRFDRKIKVDLPNEEGRLAILKVHSRELNLGDDVDLSAIAKITKGEQGASLKTMLNEAVMLAIKNNNSSISMEHLSEALDKVRFGYILDLKQSEKEIKATAYHEAGHALVALMLENAMPVEKITIIPRAQYLGVTVFDNTNSLNWKKELIASMAVSMGGRAAEEIFFNDLSAGAGADLAQAHAIAKEMTRRLGMTAGPLSISVHEKAPKEIEEEEKKLLIDAEETAKKLIQENKAIMHLIAKGLIKYKTLTKEDLDFILKHKKIPTKMIGS